jgi:hypothetical protein
VLVRGWDGYGLKDCARLNFSSLIRVVVSESVCLSC